MYSLYEMVNITLIPVREPQQKLFRYFVCFNVNYHNVGDVKRHFCLDVRCSISRIIIYIGLLRD